MKRLASLVLALCISVAAFSGCAKSSSGSANGTSEDSSKPVTLTIAWWGSQSRHDYTKKLLEDYTQLHPNVKFQSTPLGWDGYESKLSTEAAGGSMQDIVQMDYSFISTFSQNNSLANLQSYVNNKTIDMSSVDKNLLASGKINGKLTNIVISTTAMAISYNPDVWAKAGLSAPKDNWTWEEFENDMITIHQKAGVYGETELYTTTMNEMFNYWLRQYGKTLFSSDGKKLGYTDDKMFADFVNVIKKLQDEQAAPNPDQENQITAKGKEARPVVTGQAGAIFDMSNYPTIVSASNPNLKLVMLPNNESKTKPMYIKPGMFFSVSNSCKNKTAAAEFINWFINDINANKVINCERGVPVSSKIRDEMKSSVNAQTQEMFDYIDKVSADSSAIDPPSPTGAAEVQSDLSNEISAVLYGKKTAEQAASAFRTEATSVLGRNS